MKKIISILLIVILLAVGLFILTGCGEKEDPMVEETYEYTGRNVKVSISYPEGSSYKRLELHSEEGQEHRYEKYMEPNIQLLGDKTYIEVSFESFVHNGEKSFKVYKETIKSNNTINKDFTETTINGREAFYRTYNDNIILSFDMTDLMEDPTDFTSSFYLRVIVMSDNKEEVTGAELFEEEEVQKIINSIKIENMN